ncbi:MAG TPA: iron-containing alcohol dehydrogenase [Thermohalobaculum sp.]|nr:iron-containing alcohol dehydrogenase [Thermohalobaculum sp.]
MQAANWSYPTEVRFGPGRLAELAEACRATGILRPLLVTDPGVVELDICASAMAVLRDGGLEPAVFAEVRPNPVEANVTAGVAAVRQGGHDGVVVFGGGSAMDVGKSVALMVGQSRPIWDFEDVGDWWTRADADAILPVVAVPTTSGTGSETGRAGVITNTETHVKKVIFHPRMLPKVVILDPELTVGLPPALTAGTGMDAFAHCLEAYCAPSFHPMSEGIAVEGLRLVARALPRAHAQGSDIEARGMMMAAAAMGSVAFQKGLGAIHALSHPLGALYDAPHGLTNAVVMPYALAWNREAIEPKIARLAAWLELEQPDFGGFLAWVLDMRARLGVPHDLTGLGVTDDTRFEELTEKALVDPTAGGNPRPLTREGVLEMYAAALAGRV